MACLLTVFWQEWLKGAHLLSPYHGLVFKGKLDHLLMVCNSQKFNSCCSMNVRCDYFLLLFYDHQVPFLFSELSHLQLPLESHIKRLLKKEPR